MANTLKISQNYDNPYEAAYNNFKGNPWFNQSDWDSMAKRGKLDDYITVMQQTDKLPSIGKFNDDFRPDLLDTNRRFTAMVNELYGDRENKKARTEVQFDPATNQEVEVALGDMSDYDYTKYLITQYKNWQLDKIRIKEEQERKDAMNILQKTGAFAASIPGELAAGGMDFVDNVGSLFEGISNGLNAMGQGGNFSDAFRNAYTNGDWRVFENAGWAKDIREWERKYSTFRDAEGNYTNVGKILGGVAYSLGQALPSMSLNLIGGGLGKLGVDTGATVGKAATALYFTGLGSGSFYEMVNDPRMTSIPTWQILTNATIKTSFEYMIMKGMSAAFGPSQLDKLVFGQTAGKAAGKATLGAAMKRVGNDFLQEGLEELAQNFSSYLWDQAYGLAVNKKFGQLSEWNMQTAFDAFILGGLSTVSTNAMGIITTKRVNLGDKTLNKFASFVFKGDLQSMATEFNNVLNNKKLTDEQRLDAVGQMYASYRTIASVYGEIGEQRFQAATKLLQDMKELHSKLALDTEQIKSNAQAIYDSIADMHTEYSAKVVEDIIKAGMTKTVEVINKGDDPNNTSNLSEETKKKVLSTVQAVFDADKNTKRIVLTEDGNTIVTADNAMFVPIEYALADDGKMVLNTVAEQDLVNNVIADSSLKIVLNSVKGIFENVTNRTNVDMTEVIYNLFFNDNFYKVALQVSNSDMLKVLSALEGIADKATDKSVRDAIYKKKIKDSMTAMKIALANYLVLQQNAEYQHLSMLTKEQKDAIARRRWSLDLANRIIKGQKLSPDDIRLIQVRINSMPADEDIKQQVRDNINSTNQRSRQLALQVLEKYYRDVFNSPYNGRTYLSNDTVPNVMFNEFIKMQGLTIDTLLQPIGKGILYDQIVASYGEVTGETLLKYYQDQFTSYTNGKYAFGYSNGTVTLNELKIDKQQGYTNFNTMREEIYSGKHINQRNIMTLTQDTSGLLNNVVGKQVSSIHKSYLNIGDVIFNPKMLTQKMQDDITKEYGELTPMNTFLYLRNYYLAKYNTISITILANGGFSFVNVAPMLDILKQPEINTSMITENSTARNFIKGDYLQGRLGSVKIVLGTDSYYDVQANTITIDENMAKDPAYFRFALLHEFQHAIQTENQMNGGINANWLNLSGMNKTQKNNLIADVKKHMPDLFKGVKSTDLAKQLDIVNKFVYDTSGESQAFGVDATNNLVDFYPTVIKFQGAKTIVTLPWGKKYVFDGTVSNEQSLDFWGTDILPEEQYAEFKAAEKDYYEKRFKNSLLYIGFYERSKDLYTELRKTVPEIDGWTRLGNNVAPTSNEYKGKVYTEEKRNYEVNKKQNLLNAITPDVKNKMLESFRLRLLPNVPMKDFLEMDIPYVRMQVRRDVGNDPFVSIALGKIGDMSGIARMFHNVKERYIFTGTIKPKKLLGVIPSSEYEGLISPEQLNEAKVYSADYGVDTGKIGNIQHASLAKQFIVEHKDTIYKTDTQGNRVYNDDGSPVKEFDGDIAYTEQIVNSIFGELPKTNPDMNAIYDVEESLDTGEIYDWVYQGHDEISKTDLIKSFTPDVKDAMLQSLKLNTMPDADMNTFMNTPIPYIRLQTGTNIGNDLFYSASVGYNFRDLLVFGGDTIVAGKVKPSELLGYLGYLEMEGLLPPDVLRNGTIYNLDRQKVNGGTNVTVTNIQPIYIDGNPIQQQSMAKQPVKQPSDNHKWKTRVEVGKFADGSIKYKYTYDKNSYVSNKSAVGTNLEYFVQKNKQIQLDPSVQSFIVQADPSQLEPELWSMIGGDQKGTLTKQRVYEFLRKANKVNNYTFELINDHFFQNDSIKRFDQLEYLLLSDISQYYALRAVLKQVKANDLITEQISHKRFKEMIMQLSDMPEVAKEFNRLALNYDMYRGNNLEINYENLRIPFMKYFDGTIESGGHVAAIGKILAINTIKYDWKSPGEVTRGHSLDSNIAGAQMTYSDVIADDSAQDAFEAVLADKTRNEMEAEIIENLFAQYFEEVKNMATPPSRQEVMKKAAKIRSDIEDLSENDLNQYYIKTILGDVANKPTPLSELQNNQPIVRPERNISKNIRTIASKIKNFLKNNSTMKNDAKNLVKTHSDLFNEDLSLKSTVLENATREKMIEVENTLRTINTNIRNGAYHNKKAADMQKKLDTMTKRYEKEKLKNYKNSKRKVKETFVNLGGHEFTIDTSTEMPKVLKNILDTSFDKLANTDVKFLTSDGERHMQMNLKTFLQQNAVALTSLTQAEVDDIINFYLNSLPRGSMNSTDFVKYNAVKVYMLAYLLDQAIMGQWILSPEQVKNIENHLKTIAQSAGTDLAVWRSVLRLVDPNKQIIASLAKMSGIEFQDADIEQVSSAIRTGDIAQIKAAMDNLYTTGLKLYKGNKKSFWTKAWRLQRLFMLSSPGTAVRNVTSNALVTAGNTAASVVGNLFSKIPAKFRKNIQGQYKIAGTKVSEQVQSYIQTNIIDTGLLGLISDGLNKYDVRKANNKTSSDIMTDLIVRSVVSKIFSADQFDNKALQKMSNFVFKLLSDDPFVNKATIVYFGKMLQEDNFDVTKGLNEQAMITLAEAYTLATRDFMHKPSFFNKLEQGIKESGGEMSFFMYKQLLPFASASWNWFKEGLMYTPVGLVKGIIDFARLEKTVEKMEDARMRGQQIESSRFAEYLAKRNMGKGIIGSIGLGIGLLLGAFGVADIDEEDDKVKLRVGDTFVDITSIFGTQSIFLGIALTNPRKGDWEGLTIDVLDTMFNDSTLNDLMNTFRYNDNIGDWLLNQPSRALGTLIPNFIKGISKLSYNHKVQYSSGVIGQFERIATSIPGGAYAFPTKIDPYTGETQSRYNIPFILDAINMLTPVKIASYRVSDAEKLAIQLGVRKDNLTGRFNDIGNLGLDDIAKLNTKYGELNQVKLAEFYNNKTKHKVQLSNGTYKELTYSQMTSEQQKSVTERIMSNNARYSKIYVYTSNGGTYYADPSDYVVLRKLGIKNVFKEMPKKKGFN